MRQLLGGSLRRGKVEAGLYLRSTTATTPQLELNRPMVEQLLRRAADVGSMLGGIPGPMSALDILRWPGVIREAERDLTPLAGETLALVGETAAELQRPRVRAKARASTKC